MKKFAAISLSLMMMITNVFAADVSVKLNGEEVTFANQPPVIVEGRTLIPLRSIFENLGYTIEWQADTKTAVLKSDATTVTITANAETFDVNGNVITLDTPAQIINGSMMLPLRAIGEASGLEVGWNNETKVVSLDKVVENMSAEPSEEMEKFYENLVALSQITTYYDALSIELFNVTADIQEGINNGTLAFTKAVEKIEGFEKYFDVMYNKINTWKAPDDFKNAKGYLIDVANDLKKNAEIKKNYFSGVYPDEDSLTKDADAITESFEQHFGLFSSELSKFNNQFERVMFDKFDTEKDTAENKEKIKIFTEQLSAINEKYPIPNYKETEENEDVSLMTDIDKNIEMIRTSAEGRKEAFKDVNIPDNCADRMYLINCSNDILLNIADSLEKYGDYGTDELNPYSTDVTAYIACYDEISTLASDLTLSTFLYDSTDTESFGFEEHIDENYNNIQIDNISQETLDFVNLYYYGRCIEDYIDENDIINIIYSSYAESNDSNLSNKNYFREWKSDQSECLNNLKNFVVSENAMALKSAAINYIEVDMEYTSLLEQLFTRQITETMYNQKCEEYEKKFDAAEELYTSELSRISTKLENYMYDYLDLDSVRTENTEIEEFGKKVEEINKKYSISDDINYIYENYNDLDVLTESNILGLKNRADNIIANIQNRENEYKTLEVPKSCEKRAELLIAADNFVIEHAKLTKTLKAGDEDSTRQYVDSLKNLWDVYDALMSIATGGEAEYLEPGYDYLNDDEK